MTIVVGFSCLDGVVIVTDSALSYSGASGSVSGEILGPKLFRVRDDLVLAVAGDMYLSERFRLHWTEGWGDEPTQSWNAWLEHICRRQRQCFDKDVMPLMDPVATQVVAKNIGGVWRLALFGADFSPKPHSPELYYCSAGEAKRFADPFMAFLTGLNHDRLNYSVDEARLMCALTVNYVIRTAAGGVRGPMQVAILHNGRVAPTIDPGAAQELDALADEMREKIAVAISFDPTPSAAPRFHG